MMETMEKYPSESLRPVFDEAVKCGLNLWDTAYAYGMGQSEKVLERTADGLGLNLVRMWEKEMK